MTLHEHWLVSYTYHSDWGDRRRGHVTAARWVCLRENVTWQTCALEHVYVGMGFSRSANAGECAHAEQQALRQAQLQLQGNPGLLATSWSWQNRSRFNWVDAQTGTSGSEPGTIYMHILQLYRGIHMLITYLSMIDFEIHSWEELNRYRCYGYKNSTWDSTFGLAGSRR